MGDIEQNPSGMTLFNNISRRNSERHADHQADTAHLCDKGIPPAKRFQFTGQIFTDFLAAIEQAIFENSPDRGNSGGADERITAKG